MSYREAEKSEVEKEMDIVRNRLKDLEEDSGLTRAWKRVTIGLVAFGIMACCAVYASVGVMVKRDKNPCKDAIVEAPAGVTGVTCPHSDQRMDEHTIVLPSPDAKVWGVRCLCKR